MKMESITTIGIVLNAENYAGILFVPTSVDGTWVTDTLKQCLRIYPDFAHTYEKNRGKAFSHAITEKDSHAYAKVVQQTKCIICGPVRKCKQSPIDTEILSSTLQFLHSQLKNLSSHPGLCISAIRDSMIDTLPLWKILGRVSNYVAQWLLSEESLFQKRVCFMQANLLVAEQEERPLNIEFNFTD